MKPFNEAYTITNHMSIAQFFNRIKKIITTPGVTYTIVGQYDSENMIIIINNIPEHLICLIVNVLYNAQRSFVIDRMNSDILDNTKQIKILW